MPTNWRIIWDAQKKKVAQLEANTVALKEHLALLQSKFNPLIETARAIKDNPKCTCDEDRHCRELEGCPHCVLMERLKAVLLEKDKNDNGTTSTGSRELDRDMEG